MTDDELVEIDFGEVRRDESTDNAVLLCLERGEQGKADKLLWVPRSLIASIGDNVIELPLWWAEQKGLV